MANLDSVLKSRDITLLKKVHIVKSQGYGLLSGHIWLDLISQNAKELMPPNGGAGEAS